MSEELMKQLNSYKAQLQQVEVALSTDTENEDLQKLQKDLQVCVCGYTTAAWEYGVFLSRQADRYNVISVAFFCLFCGKLAADL